jgi:hypothetical protein
MTYFFGTAAARWMGDAVKVAVPLPLVVTFTEPTKYRPSSSPGGLAKNSRWKAVCIQNSDGLARLNNESFFISAAIQRFDDGVVALPIARRLASSAIHDKLFRLFRNLGIEVIHQHPFGGLLNPPFCCSRVTAGCSNWGI